MAKLPPVRAVRAATAFRTALQGATRRMVPPEVGVLELVSGFMDTQVAYAVARLGMTERSLETLVLPGAEPVAGDVEVLDLEQLSHVFSPVQSTMDADWT